MSDTEILAGKVLRTLQQRGLMLATAESCTGGLVAGAITDLNGASEVLDRGFVTYTNDAKIEMLGVSPQTIAQHGAVSEECAREMANGALRNSHADIAVSITGIAGPGGGSLTSRWDWSGSDSRSGTNRSGRKSAISLRKAAPLSGATVC